LEIVGARWRAYHFTFYMTALCGIWAPIPKLMHSTTTHATRLKRVATATPNRITYPLTAQALANLYYLKACINTHMVY